MFSKPYQAWLPTLLALCGEAGSAILSHYHSREADAHDTKDDDSPLTAADMASHRILSAGLSQFGYPVLSEESPKALKAQRHDWDALWLIDPLDGTKEFLGRTGEFTINVAFVREHRAVFGLIALPLEQQVYVGVPGEGAARHENGTWIPLHTRPIRPEVPLRVLASRRHRGERLQAFLEGLAEHPAGFERDNAGSALKFCRMAEGEGDLYPRFAPCSEWDTAAGQALLEAAGGALWGLDGQPFRYNARGRLLNSHFIAVGDPVQARRYCAIP